MTMQVIRRRFFVRRNEEVILQAKVNAFPLTVLGVD